MENKLKAMKKVIVFSEPELRQEIEKYLRDEIYSPSYFDYYQLSLKDKERMLLDAIYFLFVNEDVIDCNQDNCQKIMTILYNTIFMRFKQHRVIQVFIDNNDSLMLPLIDRRDDIGSLREIWRKWKGTVSIEETDEYKFIDKFLIILSKLDRIKNSN